jgi:hypothetical protein
MKKLVFSAIALIVFTATSMAGESKKINQKTFSENEKVEFTAVPLKVMSYCEGLYLRIKEMVMEDLNNEDIAASIAFAARKECLEASTNPNN